MSPPAVDEASRVTTAGSEHRPGPARRRFGAGRSIVAGAILAALLSALAVTVLTQLWNQPLDVPFQYADTPGDDEQDATLDMMLIKNVQETGWFDTNPKLNAPFEQHWAEWPMGGDLLAYTLKKGIVETTGDVPLTLNLFWLLTFPLTALVAFPVLRSLRCSWAAALVAAVLFSLAPYHFRNGVGAREPRVLRRRADHRAPVHEDPRPRHRASGGRRAASPHRVATPRAGCSSAPR